MKGTKVKSSKGITLVALVITIIILLILAVVAITAVNGDGIIGKAKEAGSSYNQKAGEENTELARQLGLIEEALGVEKVAGGTEVPNSNGKAVSVNDQLVYIIDNEENKTAKVTGYKGDLDYTNPSYWTNTPTTSGNVEIASKIKIGEETYTVTSIDKYAFFGMMGAATNLTSITIPNTIINIYNMAFKGCRGLTNINIPSSVELIEYGNGGNEPFAGCENLSTINVDENNLKYASENGILYNKEKTEIISCPQKISAQNLNLPNTLTALNYSFINCTGIKNITIKNNVTQVGYGTFANWDATQTINVFWTQEEGRPSGWDEHWTSDPTNILMPTYCNAVINYGVTE